MAGDTRGSSLIRWGGLAAIGSAVLGFVAELIDRIYHVELPFWKTDIGVVYQAAYGFGLALVVVTLLAVRRLHTRAARSYGWLGTISFSIACFGYALEGAGTAVLLLLYLLGGTQSAARLPGGLIHWPAILAIIIGTTLFGIAIARAQVVPRWFGITLALIIPLWMLIPWRLIGLLVATAGWIVLGATLWSYSGTTAPDPAPEHPSLAAP